MLRIILENLSRQQRLFDLGNGYALRRGLLVGMAGETILCGPYGIPDVGKLIFLQKVRLTIDLGRRGAGRRSSGSRRRAGNQAWAPPTDVKNDLDASLNLR